MHVLYVQFPQGKRERSTVSVFVCAKEHTVIHFTGFSSWPEPAERYYLFVCVCVLCVWVCAHTHTHVPRHGHATAHVLGGHRTTWGHHFSHSNM